MRPATRKRGASGPSGLRTGLGSHPRDGGGGREQRQAEPAGRAEAASAGAERRGAAAPVPPLGPEGGRTLQQPPFMPDPAASRPADLRRRKPQARARPPGARTSSEGAQCSPQRAKVLLWVLERCWAQCSRRGELWGL